MPARLALGLVGVGRIGVFHAQTLLELEGVASLTIADADVTRARRVAAELGAGAVESAAALIDAGIDALVIAAATPAHATLLRFAPRTGVPALCEAPVVVAPATLASGADG